MSIRVRRALVLAAFVAAAPFGAGLAFAQSSGYDRMAIPKPSDRKTGELEGWSEGGGKTKGQDRAEKAAKPAGKAVAQGRKPAAPPAQERDPADGGLPLPSARGDSGGGAAMFDSKGNIGTGFKF